MFENSQQTTPNANEVNKFTFKGKKNILLIQSYQLYQRFKEKD